MAADTIVATATPYGVSGIAVVRLSGPAAQTITSVLCRPENGAAPAFPARTAVLSVVHSQGAALDEVVITYFKAPGSYTGEDVVEIACHGSPVIVESIIAETCRLGARVADPGEFTRRAFLNGKLDLVQAESVAGLIQSKSVESSQLNLRLLRGQLSERLFNLRDEIISLLAEVEFELDISEDDLNPDLVPRAKNTLNALVKNIQTLIDSYQQGKLLSRGANVVIIGAPNVGKSTLLNALTNSDRAIVSTTPGTTRDTIDYPLILAGVPINLIDTAGLQQSSEQIELEGIRRTHIRIEEADLLLAVYEPPCFDQSIDFNYRPSVPLLNVYNKIDTLSSDKRQNLLTDDEGQLYISAKTGEGLGHLKTRIKSAMQISRSTSEELMLTSARQFQALSVCESNLKQATTLLQSPAVAFELVSVELREAIDAIDRLLGKTTADDIINNIFNRFCVGK
ncbi:MAG: tRNA uridine-5-carboxymethylaminomethyl(34) synthesis GTPase MnmE [Candidatus Marinimicrobia bacterium]|nr:tRNA uridine-5-carboxymethylaminomethyl(34) synthesis GTPase MnmE [Candidatus Neomarinimicrobiota bacterium]